MQTHKPAAFCARLVLTILILAVFGGTVFSQADSLLSRPEVMGPPDPAPMVEDPAFAADTGAASATESPSIPTVPQGAESKMPQSAEEPTPAPPAESWSGMTFPVLKAVGGFGLVVSLILACFLLFRRFAPQYLNKRSGERMLKLIETLPMGEKRSIALVQAGARKYLIASTPGQISMLATYHDSVALPTAETDLPAAKEPPAIPQANFRNLYELEKKVPVSRPAAREALPPDIRGKMQELRRALEG